MTTASDEPTTEQLTAYREILTVWHYSSHFQGIIAALGKRIPTSKLWGNPYKFAREAMTLAEFTKLSSDYTDVRLGNDPPDGWVRLTSGKELPVEVTEVLEPGRRRGDEYKEGQLPGRVHVTDEKFEARIQTIEPQLERAIESKVGKYQPPPLLLVYLNIADHERAQKEIEAAVAKLKTKHADSFNGIHVIWGTKPKLY